MKKEIKLIIFDFDGTLVDSEEINIGAISETLMLRGHDKYSKAHCRKIFSGCGLPEMTNIISTIERNVNLVLELIHEKAITKAKDELEPIGDVIPTLININLPICVASNGVEEMVTKYVKFVGLESFFPRESIFTSESVMRSKPFPDIFFHAASAMGHYSPEHCLVIEDSVVGVRAGVAAGMRVIGIDRTLDVRMSKTLKRAGAASVIRDMTQIFNYF